MTLEMPSTLSAAHVVRAARTLRCFTAPSPPMAAGRQGAPAIVNMTRFASLWWQDVVMGYGVAEASTDGRPTGRLAVRFYVTRKLPRTRLKSPNLIPRVLRVRATDRRHVDIPTDVVELGRAPAAQRTILAGESMGHFIGVRGTFGLAVRDRLGRSFALTCAHVVAPRFVDPNNALVESPADDDRVAGPNVMGNVFTFTRLDASRRNTADAALVKPASGVTLSNASLGLGASPRFSTVTPAQFASLKRRAAVVQSHRGAVNAVLDSIANDLPFDFDGRFFRFVDVASYAANVEPGDSGSAVVDVASRDVIGLHFAGQRVAGRGFCILASTILRTFPTFGLTVAQ